MNQDLKGQKAQTCKEKGGTVPVDRGQCTCKPSVGEESVVGKSTALWLEHLE